MKNLLLLLSLIMPCFVMNANAQVISADEEKIVKQAEKDTTKGWYYGGLTSLSISQTSLTNWAAGGLSSFALNGMIKVFADYRSNKITWDNDLNLGYGFMLQGKKMDFIKTDDQLEVMSKVGYKAFKNWYYALMASFKTQFTPGYNYPDDSVKISDFMAPAYLTIAFGLDYKPNKDLDLFIAPVTGRFIFVNNQTLANIGAFGVEKAVYDDMGNIISPGKKFKSELGGYVRFSYNRKIIENIHFSTKLDLFTNYLQDPQNIDVNWETMFSFKVNKFISASLSTQLIYDDEVIIKKDADGDGIFEVNGPRTQFKEILGIGFAYQF